MFSSWMKHCINIRWWYFFFIMGDKIRNEDGNKVDREGFDCDTKVSLFLFL